MEAEQRTLLDVINEGLEQNQAKSFIHRIVYLGEHTFDPEAILTLDAAYERIHRLVNAGYCDVPFHGVLLICPVHLIVVAEGSESTLMRHISIVRDLLSGGVGNLTMLAVHHNVEERHFTKWSSMNLRKIRSNEGDGGEELRKCLEAVKMMYTFEAMKTPKSISKLCEELTNQLDIEMLKVLVSSPSMMKAYAYADLYMTMPNYSYSFETGWPAPYDFTPRLEDFTPPSNFDTLFVELLSDIEDFNITGESEEVKVKTVNLAEVEYDADAQYREDYDQYLLEREKAESLDDDKTKVNRMKSKKSVSFEDAV